MDLRMITSTDPASGVVTDTGIEATTDREVDALALAAALAAPELAARDRAWRAEFLESLADSLETHREGLVSTARSETGLSDARLNGELSRSSFQFRLFAEAVREGSFLEAMIDHAGDTPLGPAPDVRRLLVPLGPVAVFGSSNFPFAFSVPGGDTASALAAGNPVILKAHSAHPLTSQRSFEALLEGARRVHAPEGTLGIVFGQPAGAALVAHPAVRAVGFTGSLGAAQRLQEIIDGREIPIPLYGELQSINPVLFSEQALRERGEALAFGLAASITGSGGQLCTKPGLAFVPNTAEGEAFAATLAGVVQQQPPHILLGERVHQTFEQVRTELHQTPGMRELAAGEVSTTGFTTAATLLSVDISDFSAQHTEEAFGPLVVLVRYDDVTEIAAALSQVPGSLTATIHVGRAEEDLAADLAGLVQPLAGRVLFAGFPTGVRVSWAQHHGGTWPATNSLHTSVGVTAMRRFLRPMAWQDAPARVLPLELRDDYRGVPRRVDGVLSLAEG